MTDTATEVLAEQRYEYQPKDEDGLNMGGPQVIKWTPKFVGDFSGALEAMAENNVRLQRKLREANRKLKTGQLDPEEIPAEAVKYQDPAEFKPQDLSADDLISITKDMSDPTKVKAAFEKMAQATFGASPAQIRASIVESQKASNDAKIAREVDSFLFNNPNYYICKENWNTICNWIDRFGLEPNEQNFTLAFRRLSDADILLTSGGTVPGQVKPAAPAHVEPIIVQTPVLPASGNFDDTSEFGGQIATEPIEIVNFDPSVTVPQQQVPPQQQPPAPVQRVSTSLTNGNTSPGQSAAPIPGEEFVYTSPAVFDSKGRMTNQPKTFVGVKALDAMPPEQYARLLANPATREKIDKLLASQKVNPQAKAWNKA